MSPHALVQERVARDRHYPWRVLVCCALLNLTSGAQVRPVIGPLFERCPTPDSMLLADLSDLLSPLGLQRRRANVLRRLTWDYLAGKAPLCYGCGQYALDAWALFVEGRTDLDPADHWLRPYLDWRLSGGPAVSWGEK